MTATVQIEENELVQLRLAAEHDDAVRELEREATRAKADWEEAKDQALAAKKHYDKLMNELRNFIAKGPSAQPQLFSPGISDSAEPSWQDKSIDDLPISPKMAEKLREIGVHTLGQCETFRAGKVAGFPEGAASVSGWGPKKQAEFNEAVINAIPLPVGGDEEPAGSPDLVDDAPFDGEEDGEESHELRVHDDSEPVDDGMRDIELTGEVPGWMAEEGLVAGLRTRGMVQPGGATVEHKGEQYMLSPNEFRVLEDSEVAEAV